MNSRRSTYAGILVALGACILLGGTSAGQNSDCRIVIQFGSPMTPGPFTPASRLVFQEDFVQPHGWNAPRFWSDPFRGHSILDESLHILVSKRNWNNTVKIPVKQSLQSFVLETDTRSISASDERPERYGIRFHYKGSGRFDWQGQHSTQTIRTVMSPLITYACMPCRSLQRHVRANVGSSCRAMWWIGWSAALVW